MLQEALNQAWASELRTGKLTREERARLLGLSLVTARRVLEGKPVDRPTLTIAFKSLGFAWDDSFCEFVVSTESEEAVEPVPIEPPKPRKRRWLALAIAGVAGVMLLMGFLFRLEPPIPMHGAMVSTGKWKRPRPRIVGPNTPLLGNGRSRQSSSPAVMRTQRAWRGHFAWTAILAMAAGRFEEARDRFDEALKNPSAPAAVGSASSGRGRRLARPNCAWVDSMQPAHISKRASRIPETKLTDRGWRWRSGDWARFDSIKAAGARQRPVTRRRWRFLRGHPKPTSLPT